MTSYSREYASLLKEKKRWTFASISFGNSARMMEEFWQLTFKAVKPVSPSTICGPNFNQC